MNLIEYLPKRMQNKWVLYALSAAATLLFCLLFFLLFLRGAFAGLFADQGARAMADADYEKAVNRYALALRLKKNREEIYLGYGKALAAAGEHEAAAEILERGIDRFSGAEALYMAQAQILAEDGRIGEAADFLDSVENSYINKKLQSERPRDLSYSPAHGRYSTAQKVSFEQREGETIYYTLNGKDPTLASAIYREPFTINSNATLIAISIGSNGLASPRLTAEFEIDNKNEAITFNDKKIEKMVRASLNKPSGSIYAAQLAAITDLGNENISGSIRSLKDLEYMPELTALRLDNEMQIEDFAPLAGLTELTYLSLSGCALSDGDLEIITSCTALSQLMLDRNLLSDLSALEPLQYLNFLSVAENDITESHSIPAFPLLETLNLAQNRLEEVEGLSDLKQLTGLNLSGNSISDLEPLAKLSKLIELSLAGNSPSNLKKLSKLPALVTLDISDCGLSSLSMLNDYKKLSVVRACDNQLSSLSTFNLKVSELYVSRNPLADLSNLKSPAALTYLEAAETQISDISFLAGAKNLTVLDISNTEVTDATCLIKCKKLQLLRCSEGCNIKGLKASVETK